MGFSYSEIHVSMVACTSTWLFAAYRVLRRLLAPRHSPHALTYLTFIFLLSSCFLSLSIKKVHYLCSEKFFCFMSEKLIAYLLSISEI